MFSLENYSNKHLFIFKFVTCRANKLRFRLRIRPMLFKFEYIVQNVEHVNVCLDNNNSNRFPCRSNTDIYIRKSTSVSKSNTKNDYKNVRCQSLDNQLVLEFSRKLRIEKKNSQNETFNSHCCSCIYQRC